MFDPVSALYIKIPSPARSLSIKPSQIKAMHEMVEYVQLSYINDMIILPTGTSAGLD